MVNVFCHLKILVYLSFKINQSDMNSFMLLSMPGGGEWVLIFVVVLLLFGGKKIPELMKGLGKGIREFNNARTSIEEEIQEGMREIEKKKINDPK
jgi:sec-independent protein translocase protein TatA